jgi:hypothetical protein
MAMIGVHKSDAQNGRKISLGSMVERVCCWAAIFNLTEQGDHVV